MRRVTENMNMSTCEVELQQWLKKIESTHPSNIEMGLDRLLTVYSTLRSEKLAERVVLVAGTNGKGSTIAILEKLLLGLGKTVGVYSSPHIKTYNERVRINGKNIDDGRLVEGFESVEKARKNIPLTYFEFGTLCAFKCFESEKLDVVLLEVGLGGRLDAVNIIDPDLAIITSVDIDHTEWLGNDREKIGFEKAGIFRSRVPAIYGESNPPKSVTQQALAQNIELLIYQKHFGLIDSQVIEPTNSQANVVGGAERNNSLLKGFITNELGQKETVFMPISLLPESNRLIALQAMKCLGFSLNNDEIYQFMNGFSMAGRLEIVSQDPDIMLDVAHNPHAAQFLSKRLIDFSRGQPIYAVFSALEDKDVLGVIAAFDAQITQWHVASLNCPRAMNGIQVSELLQQCHQSVEVHPSIGLAYDNAVIKARENNGVVICFGSFYVVSGIKHHIG